MKKYVLNKEKFEEFIKDKICYIHQCGWIEIWNNNNLTDYIPCNSFFLSKEIKLKKYGYPGYGDDCLGHYTQEGIFYKYSLFWKVTKSHKNGKFYIQEFNTK